MLNKLHSILIYPLILIFAHFLKGKKEDYTDFFTKNITDFSKLNILSLEYKNFDFFDKIKFYFDKTKEYHDRTNIILNIDLNKKPEEKELSIFDLSKKIDMFYTCSMLSSRISNFNIFLSLKSDEKVLDNQLDSFLRYCLISFASRKIDFLFIEDDILSNKKFKDAYQILRNFLNNSVIENFSKSGDLYVITCKKDKKKFDIIWSSSDREIELTDFNKVLDKFGNEIKEDIKISQSPIYAYH